MAYVTVDDDPVTFRESTIMPNAVFWQPTYQDIVAAFQRRYTFFAQNPIDINFYGTRSESIVGYDSGGKNYWGQTTTARAMIPHILSNVYAIIQSIQDDGVWCNANGSQPYSGPKLDFINWFDPEEYIPFTHNTAHWPGIIADLRNVLEHLRYKRVLEETTYWEKVVHEAHFYGFLTKWRTYDIITPVIETAMWQDTFGRWFRVKRVASLPDNFTAQILGEENADGIYIYNPSILTDMGWRSLIAGYNEYRGGPYPCIYHSNPWKFNFTDGAWGHDQFYCQGDYRLGCHKFKMYAGLFASSGGVKLRYRLTLAGYGPIPDTDIAFRAGNITEADYENDSLCICGKTDYLNTPIAVTGSEANRVLAEGSFTIDVPTETQYIGFDCTLYPTSDTTLWWRDTTPDYHKNLLTSPLYIVGIPYIYQNSATFSRTKRTLLMETWLEPAS